ncbi:MAG: MmgE/PrpD family protein [Bacillota bacterium]|nr:MmgE/PrpD family protein [Bacillota bacterium]
MINDLSNKFADFILDVEYEDLSDTVVEAAKKYILDYFISSMAGYKINSNFNISLIDTINEIDEKSQSNVLFNEKKVSSVNAAFLNASFGHGADIDDGHRTAQGHPGVVVIPSVLALAEAYNISNKDIITAIVVGYEFFIRFGESMNPSHVKKGFHTTGTVGAIASGAASAKVLNLNKEQIVSTLGFSAMQAAGLLQVVESNQMAKVINPGKAASNGVFAALLAKRNVLTPNYIFEGKKGFFNAFSDDIKEENLEEMFSKDFKINTTYIKLYPSCRHAHGSIDAAILLKDKIRNLDDIKKVNINVYSTAIKITGNIDIPKNEDEAKFSLKYIFATALKRGNYTLNDLDTNKGIDDEIINIINKIEIIQDDSLENREKNIRGTSIEVFLNNGTKITEKIDLPKGDFEVPAIKDDILIKMESCGDNLISKKNQNKIVKYIDEFEKENNLEKLFSLLRNL